MSDEVENRLDGWKAIANHLGRSCRTVQRWSLQYKLPVYHVGGSGGVFAYSDEIDNWFRQDGEFMQIPSASSNRSLIEMQAKITTREAIAHGTSYSPSLLDKSLAESRIEDGYRMWRLLSSKNLPAIVRSFREAVDFDPQNPEAYAGLSHALIAQGMMGNLAVPAAYSSARVAAELALRLNAGSAESNCALAWLQMLSERTWNSAREIFEKLLQSHPSNSRITVGRALLHVAEGQLHAASQLLYTASELDPMSCLPLALHTWSEYLARNYTEAMEHIAVANASGRSGPLLASIEALTAIQLEGPTLSMQRIERLLVEDPTNELLHGVLGYVAGLSLNKPKAQASLKYLTSNRSHAREKTDYAIGLTLLGLGRKEEATRSILESFRKGSLWSLGFPLDPLLAPLKQEGFEDLVRVAYPAGVLKYDSLSSYSS